jgi:hypothetical protein
MVCLCTVETLLDYGVCVECVGGVATQIVNKKIRYIFGKLLYHSYATGLIFGQAVLRKENNPPPFPLSSARCF